MTTKIDKEGILHWCSSVDKTFNPRIKIPYDEKPNLIPETFLAKAIEYLKVLASE